MKRIALILAILVLPLVAMPGAADHATRDHWLNTNGFPIRIIVVDHTRPEIYDRELGNLVEEAAQAWEDASNGKLNLVYERAAVITCDDINQKYVNGKFKICEENPDFPWGGAASSGPIEQHHYQSAFLKLYPDGFDPTGNWPRRLLCHEMGHAVGWLVHSERVSCLGTGDSLVPTEHDIAALANIYDHRD